MIKPIYLKLALKCDSFEVAIGIKILIFRVLVTIDPGRSLLQVVTTNCLIDRITGRNMVFLLRDFHAQVRENRDRWYPSLSLFGEGIEITSRIVRILAWNNNDKALCLIERRRGLSKNYLSDRSYENKRNVKKNGKVLKHELRRCEVEAMDKNVEDLEDATRRRNFKILYWRVNKLKGAVNSQSRLVPAKYRNGPQLVIGKELKQD